MKLFDLSISYSPRFLHQNSNEPDSGMASLHARAFWVDANVMQMNYGPTRVVCATQSNTHPPTHT